MLARIVFAILLSYSTFFSATSSAEPLSGLTGEWVARDVDAPIVALSISAESSSTMAVGSISLQGQCWQCDEDVRNIFSLSPQSYAVLPVSIVGAIAESLELSISDQGKFIARLTYREEPETCVLPFNCRWEIIEQVQIEMVRN